FAEACLHSAGGRHQIEQLRGSADGVTAFGDLDRIAFAGLRDRVAERAARPEAVEAVALVAAGAGYVARFAVVRRCWEDATRKQRCDEQRWNPHREVAHAQVSPAYQHRHA